MIVYMFVYRLLYPFVLFVARSLSFLHPKLRQGFLLRKTHHWRKQNPSRPVIWIHCASGEFEYAKPVLRLIKEKHPEEQVLVTYFSPSIHRSVSENIDVDLSCPMPVDRPGEWRDFINHYKPRCLLIARTDLWPEMITACRRHEIPSLLFSATVTEQSGRTQSWIKSFYARLFLQLTDVFCVSKDDADVLQNIDPTIKASVAGDTRFDQVLQRLRNQKKLPDFLTQTKTQADIVIGSSWQEDEAVILEALKKIEGFKTILAPHEPTPSHLEDIESRLKNLGLTSQRYSQVAAQMTETLSGPINDQPAGKSPTRQTGQSAGEWTTSVLLIDQVGILAELYQLAPLAFVGGSFKKTVHSVMEPLASGSLTFVGPLHQNNREALAFKNITLREDQAETLTAVTEVKNSTELTFAVRCYQSLNEDEKSGISKKIISEIEQRSGASHAVLDWIHRHTLVKA